MVGLQRHMGVPTHRHCKSMNGGIWIFVRDIKYLKSVKQKPVKNAMVNHSIHLNATNG